MDSKEVMYRTEDKGAKEFFSMIIYRPAANFILRKFIKDTRISPDTVSFISLLTAAAASFLFFLNEYRYLVLGSVFLNVAYVFDVLDGQLARHQNKVSAFGGWLDSTLDSVKMCLLFAGVSCGVYLKTNEPLALVFGFFALCNTFLTCYMMHGKQLYFSSNTFTVTIGGKVYIGYEITLYLILTLFALTDNLYPALIFFATVGTLSWIKIFFDICRLRGEKSEER